MTTTQIQRSSKHGNHCILDSPLQWSIKVSWNSSSKETWKTWLHPMLFQLVFDHFTAEYIPSSPIYIWKYVYTSVLLWIYSNVLRKWSQKCCFTLQMRSSKRGNYWYKMRETAVSGRNRKKNPRPILFSTIGRTTSCIWKPLARPWTVAPTFKEFGKKTVDHKTNPLWPRFENWLEVCNYFNKNSLVN